VTADPDPRGDPTGPTAGRNVGAADQDVPVAGGRLRVARWGAGPPAVLAVHGITASHLAWAGVAARLPGVPLLAPDLRGRGRSSELPGPYGMARHADDVLAVLDQSGAERVVLAGHSMGGFVALALAARHPERVSSLVLIDGGPPLPRPEGVTVEEALAATLGPAVQRLSMTFPSREAYRDYWRAHPALTWGPLVEAYVDYDLVGEPPRLHSCVRPEAVRADYVDMLGPGPAEAVAALPRPAVLLLASRGLLNEPRPLYPPDVAAELAAQAPRGRLRVRTVEDVNHYSIVFAPHGIEAVAAAILEAVQAAA